MCCALIGQHNATFTCLVVGVLSSDWPAQCNRYLPGCRRGILWLASTMQPLPAWLQGCYALIGQHNATFTCHVERIHCYDWSAQCKLYLPGCRVLCSDWLAQCNLHLPGYRGWDALIGQHNATFTCLVVGLGYSDWSAQCNLYLPVCRGGILWMASTMQPLPAWL